MLGISVFLMSTRLAAARRFAAALANKTRKPAGIWVNNERYIVHEYGVKPSLPGFTFLERVYPQVLPTKKE